MALQTQVLPTSFSSSSNTSTIEDPITQDSLSKASYVLQAGKLVAFPTETVYGLGASIFSDEAVSKIFEAKGRPGDNPLIVHVSSRKMLDELLSEAGAGEVNQVYQVLMERFWPGPLTLIFNLPGKSSSERVISSKVTAGQPSIGIRMPSHKLALALIEKCGLPLAAPSANISSRPSPTSADHVLNDLQGRLDIILDGGKCGVGVESTVIDLFENQIRVLRAGGVSAEEIEQCLKENQQSLGNVGLKVYKRDFTSKLLEEQPTTPGMKYKHYSPVNARVLLAKFSKTHGRTLDDFLLDLGSSSTMPRVGLMVTDETTTELSRSNHIRKEQSEPNGYTLGDSSISIELYSIGSRTRPIESAQRLFAGLRHFDYAKTSQPNQEGSDSRVDLIILECLNETGIGMAVMERARKASGEVAEVELRT